MPKNETRYFEFLMLKNCVSLKKTNDRQGTNFKIFCFAAKKRKVVWVHVLNFYKQFGFYKKSACENKIK